MAHRKLRQSHVLTQNKNTSTWPANKSPAMCKTGHNHAANEKTHKPRVHTRHDNMKARSPWKTQAACHTAQHITWMHAADKTRTACNTTKHTWTEGYSRPHTHTTRQNTERECPNPDTKPKLKTRVFMEENICHNFNLFNVKLNPVFRLCPDSRKYWQIN